MNTSTPPLPTPARTINRLLDRLSPRQRQHATAASIMLVGVGVLWLIFSVSGSEPVETAAQRAASEAAAGIVDNLGVMPPGQQVSPVDQWVGTAGHKLAQYENERDEQTRINRDREAFEARTLQRFNDLEQKLNQQANARLSSATVPMPPATPDTFALPAAAPLPPPPPPRKPTLPFMDNPPLAGNSSIDLDSDTAPALVRLSVRRRAEPNGENNSSKAQSVPSPGSAVNGGDFLPVGITRARLLGGLDAPTGGQAQSNPQPVLIQLVDTSILPNRLRADYSDCFVIAAGYGDISSERAYLRTESLSCTRRDGRSLEVNIHGSVFGEDGKLGLRGRLVTKQGQMLANALLAGISSGIGQGLSTSASSTSTSALGTISTTSGSDAFRAGIGSGVGRALDRLANYYIKLAEQTFPVVEVDAGRQIDVVLTRGVRLDAAASEPAGGARSDPTQRYQQETNDEDY